MFNLEGVVCKGEKWINTAQEQISQQTNLYGNPGTIDDVIQDADVLIGVSAPGVLKPRHIQAMAADPIVFAMANPIPEISRGALDAKAKDITME
ncbi:hypothetical protein ACQKP0_15855 [Heyndrickxia sp. NPDC080065]|uniref:hypothetical protein n=1 Tax=Heyndrickxia sp. NPDC080065 TaxID=3390568 RepID=UPI003D00C074